MKKKYANCNRVRKENLLIKVTEEEKEKILQGAFSAGMSFSQWARVLMLNSIKKED